MNVILDFPSTYMSLLLCLVPFALTAAAWTCVRVLHQRKRHHKAFTSGHKHYNHDVKQGLSKSTSQHNYASVFPPSQCARAFAEAGIVNPASRQKNILEIDRNYKFASPDIYVFSGFSVKHVLGLGDFPDYAKLSGVPLPSPLSDFCIGKAVPRPYRPLRWVYHQTMGN